MSTAAPLSRTGADHRRRPWHVAMFVGSFPLLSETFVLRHITGLIEAGNTVDIYADCRGQTTGAVHPEVQTHGLLDRTVFMDMPPEMAPAEIPVWPWTGRTWPPGSAESVWNGWRVLRALPCLARCLVRAPRLTWRVLRTAEYGYQAASLSALHRLDRLAGLRRHHDVLHAQFGPVGNSFRFARDLFGAPLIVTFHGYDFCTVPRKQGRDIYRALFACADAVTVNSRYTREQVLSLGCRAERLHHLPMGVDVDQFPFRERTWRAGESFRVLTVARLVPIKGHGFALRALARLRSRHPAIQYDLVGDGPLRSALEQQAGELGLKEVVRFHPGCDRAGLRRWFEQAHVFVLPSVTVEGDREGQGLVVQEAQASGLPVIVTDHGGLPEGLRPDESGFVVPEGNEEALADKLGVLAKHPERWPAMGQAGRRFVAAQFDHRQLTGRLLEIYKAARQNYAN